MTGVASVRVLVVDNQSAHEDTVSVLLRRGGNEVRTVCGGLFPMDEALEFAPELVLVHVDRPQFDAVSLVRRFREGHSFGSVPLVAMSSECGPESCRAGIAAGFDRWLVKPIPFDELSAMVADVRGIISMPQGLAQRTIDQVVRFDALKLEQDDQRRIERLDRP